MATDDEPTPEQGLRSAQRDHALVQLDEEEVRVRVLAAFDAFVGMGFEVHLIGYIQRGARLYKLLLAEDGADDIPLRKVQELADEHRLDIFFERGHGLSMYARW